MASSSSQKNKSPVFLAMRTLANYPMDIDSQQLDTFISHRRQAREKHHRDLVNESHTSALLTDYGRRSFEHCLVTHPGRRSTVGNQRLSPSHNVIQFNNAKFLGTDWTDSHSGPTITGSPLHNKHWQVLASIRQRVTLPRLQSNSQSANIGRNSEEVFDSLHLTTTTDEASNNLSIAENSRETVLDSKDNKLGLLASNRQFTLIPPAGLSLVDVPIQRYDDIHFAPSCDRQLADKQRDADGLHCYCPPSFAHVAEEDKIIENNQNQLASELTTCNSNHFALLTSQYVIHEQNNQDNQIMHVKQNNYDNKTYRDACLGSDSVIPSNEHANSNHFKDSCCTDASAANCKMTITDGDGFRRKTRCAIPLSSHHAHFLSTISKRLQARVRNGDDSYHSWVDDATVSSDGEGRLTTIDERQASAHLQNASATQAVSKTMMSNMQPINKASNSKINERRAEDSQLVNIPRTDSQLATDKSTGNVMTTNEQSLSNTNKQSSIKCAPDITALPQLLCPISEPKSRQIRVSLWLSANAPYNQCSRPVSDI